MGQLPTITCLVTKIFFSGSFVVSFVYALNTVIERRVLWNELVVIVSLINYGLTWCLVGDFHVCLGPNETSNFLHWTASMFEFYDFFCATRANRFEMFTLFLGLMLHRVCCISFEPKTSQKV